MRKIIFLASLIYLVSCTSTTDSIDHSLPPQWAQDAVWYQIFVERFRNGDPSNDPTPETIYAESDFFDIPSNWHITPWNQNWYKEDEWAEELGMDFYARLQLRRYGGDLQGILDNLDYLSDLGITAVYFNPLNDAPSLHKYDARNYHHIDVNFGPDPEGDMEIIRSEDPNNPNTWKWTSADLMFLKLVKEFHQRGIRVILDYSWNHTGVEFWAWKDLVKNQTNSKYMDWYEITSFNNPETENNEFDYKGWLNIKSLPEFKKIDVVGNTMHGSFFEGNLHPEVKEHIFQVTKRWLAPNDDTSKGIDGFRLDVADHIPLGFWREYRQHVKSINPEAYLVGEIWWENWPHTLMDPTPYLKGDVFDAVMFYQAYRPAKYFFSKSDFEIDAQQLVDSLNLQWGRIGKEFRNAMMNTATTHDSPRLLTCFANPSKYKYGAKLNDNPHYIAGKPNRDTYQRVMLYLLHQFTIPGAPHIWNGEEMGMWGADDPDCRKPLWWPDFSFEPETRHGVTPYDKAVDEVKFNNELFDYYKKLIEIRKNNQVLSNGDIEFIIANGKTLAYKRFNETETLFVLFNLETYPVDFPIDMKSELLNLMTGETLKGSAITLEPLSAMLLKPTSVI